MRKRSQVAKKPEPEEVEPPAGTKMPAEKAPSPRSIEETSRELQEELEDIQFEVARPPKGSALDPGFAKIVASHHLDDPFSEYQELEAALKVQDKRNDHGSIMSALNDAETNARRAFRLYFASSIERRRWHLDNALVLGAMREQATRKLQAEKEAKIRNKMITDADVEGMAAILFPDEWREQQLTAEKVERTEKSMAHLAEMWASRCKSLNAMLSRSR